MRRNWSELILRGVAAAIVMSAAAGVGRAQTTINGSRTITGTWDASGAARTMPAKSGTTPPASCAVGEAFFKTDAVAGQNWLLCTAANTWTAVVGSGGGSSSDPDRRTTFHIEDEFASGHPTSGQIGSLGWFMNTTASAGFQSQQSVVGHRAYPGLWGGSTSTTANNVVEMALPGNGSGQSQFAVGRVFDMTWYVGIADDTTQEVRIGMKCSSDGNGANNPAAGLWFEINNATNGSNNWHAVSKNQFGGRTATSLGVVPAGLDVMQRFRVRRIDASTIGFSVNEGTEATISTNLPDANTNNHGCNSFLQVMTTDGVANSYRVDYYSLKMTGLSR